MLKLKTVKLERCSVTKQQRSATVEHKLGLWHGMAGYHYTESDYDADGEEAFTPASVTKSNALFLLEEKQFGDVTVQVRASKITKRFCCHIG